MFDTALARRHSAPGNTLHMLSNEGAHKAKCIFQGRKNAFCGPFVHPSKALKLRGATKQNAFSRLQICILHFLCPSRPSNYEAPQSKMHFSRPRKCILQFHCPSLEAIKFKGLTKPNAFSTSQNAWCQYFISWVTGPSRAFLAKRTVWRKDKAALACHRVQAFVLPRFLREASAKRPCTTPPNSNLFANSASSKHFLKQFVLCTLGNTLVKEIPTCIFGAWRNAFCLVGPQNLRASGDGQIKQTCIYGAWKMHFALWRSLISEPWRDGQRDRKIHFGGLEKCILLCGPP